MTYEGQIAVAWNLAAEPGDHGGYPFAVVEDPVADGLASIDLRPMVREVVADLIAGVAAAIVSARFHDTLIAATVEQVKLAAAVHGRLPIVLTGGAFQNVRLAEGVARGLAGLDVHLHGEVPPGDGGIALGQVLVADAIARR
jgi:hydrogenase maturation protein HypF